MELYNYGPINSIIYQLGLTNLLICKFLTIYVKENAN